MILLVVHSWLIFRWLASLRWGRLGLCFYLIPRRIAWCTIDLELLHLSAHHLLYLFLKSFLDRFMSDLILVNGSINALQRTRTRHASRTGRSSGQIGGVIWTLSLLHLYHFYNNIEMTIYDLDNFIIFNTNYVLCN